VLTTHHHHPHHHHHKNLTNLHFLLYVEWGFVGFTHFQPSEYENILHLRKDCHG
jgi:hypothetical protein